MASLPLHLETGSGVEPHYGQRHAEEGTEDEHAVPLSSYSIMKAFTLACSQYLLAGDGGCQYLCTSRPPAVGSTLLAEG